MNSESVRGVSGNEKYDQWILVPAGAQRYTGVGIVEKMN